MVSAGCPVFLCCSLCLILPARVKNLADLCAWYYVLSECSLFISQSLCPAKGRERCVWWEKRCVQIKVSITLRTNICFEWKPEGEEVHDFGIITS